MLPLLVSVAVGLTFGLIVGLVARRWPKADPTSPHLAPSSIREEVRSHPRLRRALKARLDPTTATGLGLTAAVAAVVGGAIAIGALLAMIHSNAGLARYDLSLARFGADHKSPISTSWLRLISQLGGAYVMLPLAFIVGVVEYRRLPNRALPFFLVLAVGGQFLVANLIKWAVSRARPNIDRLTGFAGTSFPSGHATAAAATYAVFALLLGRRRSRATKAALVGASGAIAVTVGFTRIMLGVHWFTDVIGGLLLGWGWFALCSIAFGGSILRFGAPAEIGHAVAKQPSMSSRGP